MREAMVGMQWGGKGHGRKSRDGRATHRREFGKYDNQD